LFQNLLAQSSSWTQTLESFINLWFQYKELAFFKPVPILPKDRISIGTLFSVVDLTAKKIFIATTLKKHHTITSVVLLQEK